MDKLRMSIRNFNSLSSFDSFLFSINIVIFIFFAKLDLKPDTSAYLEFPNATDNLGV